MSDTSDPRLRGFDRRRVVRVLSELAAADGFQVNSRDFVPTGDLAHDLEVPKTTAVFREAGFDGDILYLKFETVESDSIVVGITLDNLLDRAQIFGGTPDDSEMALALGVTLLIEENFVNSYAADLDGHLFQI